MAQIPTFSLYGEQQQWPTPDLMHWESVAERSRLHNWLIRPHRHGNLLQFIYLQSGRASAQLDGQVLELTPPCLLVIPALCVHGFEFSAAVEGHVVTVATALLTSLTQHSQWLPTKPLLIGNEAAGLEDLFVELAGEYLQLRPQRDWALQLAVSRLALWVARQQAQKEEIEPHAAKGSLHFAQFSAMVEQHFRDHRPLSFYARELGISVAHLNSVCRQVANRSALQVIHERLLLEAKRSLVYTAMTASEIAASLGFSEPAYFSRFFKRHLGRSPQAFRRGS